MFSFAVTQVQLLGGCLNQHGYTDGEAAKALFDKPSIIAVDRHGGVIVVDAGPNVLRRIDSMQQSVTTLNPIWPSLAHVNHAMACGTSCLPSPSTSLARATSFAEAHLSAAAAGASGGIVGSGAGAGTGGASAGAGVSLSDRPMPLSSMAPGGMAQRPASANNSGNNSGSGQQLLHLGGGSVGGTGGTPSGSGSQRAPLLAECRMALASSLDLEEDVLWLYDAAARALLRLPLAPDSPDAPLVAQVVCTLDDVPQVGVGCR